MIYDEHISLGHDHIRESQLNLYILLAPILDLVAVKGREIGYLIAKKEACVHQ